jgi:hypothetical protein
MRKRKRRKRGRRRRIRQGKFTMESRLANNIHHEKCEGRRKERGKRNTHMYVYG